MGKRKTYDDVKIIINNFGYELLSKEYINNYTKLDIKDIDGYYYQISLHNIKDGKYKPKKFDILNIYTIQNIKLWLKLNNKPFELISNKYEGSNEYLEWKCSKEKCNEIFEMKWKHIIVGINCPFCSGDRVGLSNCLATKHPELISEWHPTLNGDLTPYDVTAGSGKNVWWICSKNHKHEWHTDINNRTVNNNGCPYCAGYYASEDYNLLVINPILCEEWDYNKNDKRPEEYCPGSREYAYWKCKDCGHNWNSLIKDRNKGIGCPECNKSKGEKKIDKILINNNWIKISQEEFDKLSDKNKYNKNYFIPQIKYNGLIGLGGKLLSYDFYLPRLNFLIEYDGEYHFIPIKNYKSEPIEYAEERLRKQQYHDKLKDNYTINNNINLLRIPFWNFDNIEEILDNYLNI